MGTDDIDIGINVRVNGDAQAIVDQLRNRLGALRDELQRLVTQQHTDVVLPGGLAPDAINRSLGAFKALGQTVDVTNARAIAAFKQEGDEVIRLAAQLGATNAQLAKFGQTVALIQQRAGAVGIGAGGPGGVILPAADELDKAGKKVQLFGNAADATFQRVPRGARSAANAFMILSFAAQSGGNNIAAVTRSIGMMAFGLSQLSSNANVVAGAAGIGALVTILATVFELMRGGTEEAQKEAAAFKEIGNSAEGIKKTAEAVTQLKRSTADLKGFRSDLLPQAGETAAQQKALEALAEAKKNLESTGTLQKIVDPGGAVKQLQKDLLAGRITNDQYQAGLGKLAQVLKDNKDEFGAFSRVLRDATKDGAAFAAALVNVQFAASEAAKANEDIKKFGPAPELPKKLEEVNQQMIALSSSGAVALRNVQATQKALDLATESWFKFTSTEAGAKFAGVGFADALDAQSAAAKKAGPDVTAAARSILGAAQQIVRAEEIVSGGTALADLARKEVEKARQLDIARTQGDAAARRQAADDEFDDAKRQLARMVGFGGDRAKALAALEKTHTEEILKINKDENDKLTALLTKFEDDRIASIARLADDEFGARRAAARKQFDTDSKAITDLHLIDSKDKEARKQAGLAFTASLEVIEKDRSDRIEEIRITAQQHIDDLLGKTGAADPAKIRDGYKKQLDLLAATIASSDTTPAEKAAAEFGQRLIEESIPLDIAKARFGELQKSIGAATTAGDSAVTRTSALLAAHAISERQAREDIVAALTRERDIIAATLPLLQEQADKLPGNEEAQAQLEQYKTKLLELNLTIARTADAFFKLKETTRDATTSALATFFEQSTKLGTQNKSEIRALAGELQNASDELNGLLSIPSAKRTPEENQRITDLRNEVERTTIALDNAKQSITTWRDLFLSAAQSIVDALVKVASQMLATSIIESALGFLSGLGGSAASNLGSNLTSGGVLGRVNSATGGMVNGPAGIDQVRNVNLTAGEFVHPVPTVDYYGEDFMRALQARLIPREELLFAMGGLRPISVRPVHSVRGVRRNFAEGGLVTAGGSGEAGPIVHHFVLHAPPGFTAEHLDSPAGHKVLVKIVADRRNSFNSALGR